MFFITSDSLTIVQANGLAKMLFALLTLLSLAFANTLPGEGPPGAPHGAPHGAPDKWGPHQIKDEEVKVTKIWNGGVGGGISGTVGDIGIGNGGGCDPAACDAEVRYIYRYPKRSRRY